VRDNGPPEMAGIELISMPELREIRRLWVVEKHEIEDSLPRIYEDVIGEPFPDGRMDDSLAFGREEIDLLKELCGDDLLHFQLTRELLDLERQHRSMARRAGLFKALEQSLRRGSYGSLEEATETAFRRRDLLDELREDEEPELTLPFTADSATATDPGPAS
jgi:DNA sulfur modification protein DndC